MNRLKLFLVLLVFAFSTQAYPKTVITVQGTYMQASKKYVEIKNKRGEIIKVPKKV